MDNRDISRKVEQKRVQITDDFWKKEIMLVKDTVLPYQWEALNDRIPDAQPSYCMHNFKVAGRMNRSAQQETGYVPPVYTTNGFCVWPENPEKPGERFYGFVFQDSDFAKWIEAAAYILQQYPNPKLEEVADRAIDIVCEAQQPDGYLDTFYIINDMSKRFTDLRNNHELYCLGHLIEGAVAYYQTTGKDKLLRAACRYAECVEKHIGPDPGQLHGYPGHEIAEMALARLYELTGCEKYRDLGLYFINERGKKPYYYDRENSSDAYGEGLRYQYQQAHQPVREQTEAVGHAVRAVYLYSGMADFARLTLDDSLKAACEKLWDDVVGTKMYITGGVGGTHIGEAFSYAYDLPNDTAYAETCASVGMIFWARRMLEIEQKSKYADVMERELYNVVLSGMGLEGDSFFYVNPLEVVPEACRKDARKEYVKPVRQKWFGCACCPPNIARLIGSIGTYIYTETEDTVFVHLYVGSRMEKKLRTGKLQIDMQSGFPWNGNVSIQIRSAASEEATIALRIPEWSQTCRINGIEDAQTKEENGYLYITKVWGRQDLLQIEFPMEVRILEADYRVREDIGKVAVMRGPLVYCLEEADNGKDLHTLKVDGDARFETVEKKILTETVTAVRAQGWRQKTEQRNELYTPYTKTEYVRTNLTWIPYYAWANRGEGEMQVWTRI